MRFAWRWTKRIALALVILVLMLLAPVGWNAVACRGDAVARATTPRIDPDHRRAQAATYLTYPEWHIVFAYDDYAQVIATGDPHDFGYLRAITGFWSALCDLTEVSDRAGGAPETMQMVHVIGVSFTAELLAKAAYEETFGRIVTLLRGDTRAETDDLSARQARAYADFLHQTPWYKYDFARDAAALSATGDGVRNAERRIALGAEYAVKQAYAGVIEQAVAATGQAALTIRSIVRGLDVERLHAIDGVTVIAVTPDGTEIETPRYAAFTDILAELARQGGQVVEIAGADRIMLTATGNTLPAMGDVTVLAALPRQGYDDTRWLLDLPIDRLSATILILQGADEARLEHIFDY